MLNSFEDAFMDAQARIISLCIELLETSNISADKIYVYIFQNEAQDFINTFFEKDRKIYSLNEWFSYEEIDEFFDCRIEDVENIIDICNTYKSKCPNVFKLIFNIKTKAFDSNYEYEDIISEKDCDLIDEFEKWKKSVEIILQNINVILNNTPMKAQTTPPTRKEVLNIYNEDVRIQFPDCNQSHKFEGVKGDFAK